MFRCVALQVCLLSLCVNQASTFGFTLFDAGGFNGYTYLKWGEPAVGSPAEISFSLLPNGTSGSSYCQDACPGLSTSTLAVWDEDIMDFVDQSLLQLLPELRQAMDAWEAVANIRIRGPAMDTGLTINDALAQPPASGDIRIGVFAFQPPAQFVAGVGYAPPPNGGTGAGEILFNRGVYFQRTRRGEGEPLDLFPPDGGPFMNDLVGLFVHELGHALGLAHPENLPFGECAVMSIEFDCFSRVNHFPDADDILGIRTLYGFNPDLNADGLVDCSDIDALSQAVRQGSSDAFWDLDLDGMVGASDRSAWLAQAGEFLLPSGGAFLPGDGNLDGVVDASDFNLWNANKFTSEDSWCRGDFDGDGAVDASDFNVWNANKFRSSSPSMVPEPTSKVLMLAGFGFLGARLRRHSISRRG